METELNDPLEIVAKTLCVQVQQEPGIVVEEYNEHKKHANTEADLAETSDSELEAGDNRYSGTCSHTPYNNDLIRGGHFDGWIHALNTYSK